MTKYKNYPAAFLLIGLIFVSGCVKQYQRIEELDVNKDGKTDVIRYFNNDEMEKEVFFTPQGAGERSKTVYWNGDSVEKITTEYEKEKYEIYYKQSERIELSEQVLFKQQMDAGKSEKINNGKLVGSSYLYHQNHRIVSVKSLNDNGGVKQVTFYDSNGFIQKRISFSDALSITGIEIYDTGKLVRMLKASSSAAVLTPHDIEVLKLIDVDFSR